MFLVWSALLVALDQATKLWAQARFALHGEELPLALGFSFTYTRNSGAAFGMLRNLSIPIGPFVLDGTLVLGLLSAAVAAGLIAYLWRRGRSLDALTYGSLAIVLAGAVGNAIDRLRLGYVIDFIHFQVGSFDFPVFNVADSCVVVGAGLLLIHSFRSDADNRAEHPEESETA
jgi:signal peptidase II